MYPRGPLPYSIVARRNLSGRSAPYAAENSDNLLAQWRLRVGKLDGWKGNGEVFQDEADSGRSSAAADRRVDHRGHHDRAGATYKVLAWVKIASSEGADWGGMRL